MTAALGVLVGVVVWVWWKARKRRRETRLSGTVAENPVFYTGPPSRRVSPRSRERL